MSGQVNMLRIQIEDVEEYILIFCPKGKERQYVGGNRIPTPSIIYIMYRYPEKD